MDNDGKLYSQVAAETGVANETAMVACYLAGLARQGKTLDQAAALMRQPRYAMRNYARDWGISFSDYTASTPMRLEWVKHRRGLWILPLGGETFAIAEADGKGGYFARICGDDDGTHIGSSADVAIKRLSLELERRCLELFGVDDVTIYQRHPTAGTWSVAPAIPENVSVLRAALAA